MVRSAGLVICLLLWMLAFPAAQFGPRGSGAALVTSEHSSSLSIISTRDRYPDLIASKEAVSTIAVSAVLAVEKTDGRSRRAPKRDRLVERFFENMEELWQPPNHLEWHVVAISAPMDGWTRFPPAEQWLKNYPGRFA